MQIIENDVASLTQTINKIHNPCNCLYLLSALDNIFVMYSIVLRLEIIQFFDLKYQNFYSEYKPDLKRTHTNICRGNLLERGVY